MKKLKKKIIRIFPFTPASKSAGRFFEVMHVWISVFVFASILGIALHFYLPIVRAGGLDNVAVSLSSETVNADAQVTVSFEVGNLSNGEAISIYLGEDTTGDEWNADSITTSHISCSDNGTGETYTPVSVNAATASDPMNVSFTATTVGSGATTVTCLVGNGGANNPNNPGAAGSYSVSVATTDDNGAGIAYVGNANDITVSVNMLSNLSLRIDNADGTRCTTASGITTCNLGTVLTTTVATGNYDVNVGTNATNGASMQINSDGNIRNGVEFIAPYIEDSGTITAGTEEYGIDVSADAAWTKQGVFTDDASPVPAVATAVATTAGPINIAGNDVTITHKAAIDSTVVALSYSHVVTWTATANF